MKPITATAVLVVIGICCLGAISAKDKGADLVQSKPRAFLPPDPSTSLRAGSGTPVSPPA